MAGKLVQKSPTHPWSRCAHPDTDLFVSSWERRSYLALGET